MNTINRRRLAALAMVTTAALWTVSPRPAAAAGFYVPPHGVRPLGRGGAGVVGVWDLNALWYNPALLMGIEGDGMMLDLTVVHQSIAFQRAPRTLDNGTRVVFDGVDNRALPQPIPQLGATSSFGLDKLKFALGIYAPNAAPAEYPEDGPQRYAVVDTGGSLLLWTNAAVAYQPVEWLRLGLGLQNLVATLHLISVTSGYPGFVGDPEDEDMDILLETNLASYLNPSANAGVWLEATEGLEFGLSVQLPIHVQDDDAKVQVRMPQNPLFDNAEMAGDTVKGSFDLPLVLRGGARVVGDRWDAELNLVLERWSVFEEIPTDPLNMEIINAPGVGTIPVGAMSVPRDFQDTLSVRVGGDFEVAPDILTLRAGGFWEQSAVPTKTLTVLQVDMDKVGLGLGGTWSASERIDVDFGYTHIFYASADVTDSEMRQINSTNPDGATVIGNGTYEASADLVGAGLRVGF